MQILSSRYDKILMKQLLFDIKKYYNFQEYPYNITYSLESLSPFMKGYPDIPSPRIPRASCLHESERWNHAVCRVPPKVRQGFWRRNRWLRVGWLGGCHWAGWVVQHVCHMATWRIAVSTATTTTTVCLPLCLSSLFFCYLYYKYFWDGWFIILRLFLIFSASSWFLFTFCRDLYPIRQVWVLLGAGCCCKLMWRIM